MQDRQFIIVLYIIIVLHWIGPNNLIYSSNDRILK